MRIFLRFVLGLVIVLVVVWLGLWWYAEGRMQAGLAAWAEQIAAKGGQVSYDGLRRGTSPATAAITLSNVRITLPPGAPGQNAVVTLPRLGLRIDALTPLLLHIDLPSRINIGFNDVSVAITFGSVAETVQLDRPVLLAHENDPFRGGDFNANDVSVLASGGSLLVLHMDRLNGHFTVDPNAGVAGVALQETFSADGFALSPLLTHLLSLPFDGRIAHLAFGTTLSGPVPDGLPALLRQLNGLPPADITEREKLLAPVVRQWAAAGGNGRFSAGVTVGPSNAAADVTIKFDANVQPTGTANLTADHLDQFTGALVNAYPALQGTVAQVEAKLSPYITTSDQAGQSLIIHGGYGADGVVLNGQKVGPMPHLDWDALENPPKADGGP